MYIVQTQNQHSCTPYMLLSVQEHPYVQCIYSILQIPEHTDYINQENSLGTSLVVQWLRIHLPMQGTQVRALVREDPTGRGAAKPMHHNY